MSELLRNPKHWLERAGRTRASAENIFRDDAEKQKLLRVAEEYERIAENAERRAASEAGIAPARTKQATR